MAIASGRLRHRVQVQRQQQTRNPQTGAVSVFWVDDGGPVWAEIAPLSAREFIQSGSKQSQIVARITLRHRPLTASHRIVHKSAIYDVHGALPDVESGLEYITVPVSLGTNDGQ